MKIAVLSDIHGNMEALGAVLEHMKGESVDKVYVCGDLAMAGPEPSLAVDFFRQYDAAIIQGNTDEMIVKNIIPPIPVMAEALKYSQQVLNDEQKSFLANLPVSHQEKIEDLNLLFVHGSPRRNNEDILPNQPSEKIADMIKDTTADVIFCGHTHLPCGYQIKKQTVVNVGSVGRPFSEELKACYVTVNINKNEAEILHHFVEYDVDTAAEKLLKTGFLGAEKLASMLKCATSRYPE
ncbi:MAG: metallophosphoesterase family protein [Candidatus Gastranaerophilales bacterium]|nr:metallophosphoesterase family protein [Candidatus Gastranaerophilales bacterium]